MRNKILEKKMKENFEYPNIQVNGGKIQIWYGVTKRPPAFGSVWTEWIPYPGGPLYGEVAMENCYWLCDHIEKYRDLLPEELKNAEIEIVKI